MLERLENKSRNWNLYIFTRESLFLLNIQFYKVFQNKYLSSWVNEIIRLFAQSTSRLVWTIEFLHRFAFSLVKMRFGCVLHFARNVLRDVYLWLKEFFGVWSRLLSDPWSLVCNKYVSLFFEPSFISCLVSIGSDKNLFSRTLYLKTVRVLFLLGLCILEQ